MESFFLEQYRTVAEGAAVVDRSERGRILVIGADRLSYLHAMLTNDIAALRSAGGCYAAYLTPQGRMIADMRVLELGDLALLDVEPAARPVVLEKLEQMIFSEDVRLVDATADLAEVGVYGARASDAIAGALRAGTGPLTRDELDELDEYQSVRAPFEDGSTVVVADREFGVPGFVAYVDGGRAPALVAAIGDEGAVHASDAVLETFRVEAGRPRFGVDMDETTIPLEAGIEGRAISFTKGCYPGQEVIVRVVHRGHGRVAKKLVGMVLAGSVTPGHGDRVAVAGKEIGTVTSTAFSPALGAPIALGYVQRDFAGPGSEVSIAHGDQWLAAKVVEMPFVRR